MSTTWGSGYFTGLAEMEYDLPHPRLPLPVVFLVRKVLIRAFALLRERQHVLVAGSLAAEKEDPITLALVNIIENDFRQKGSVPGFDREHFEAVTRQHPVEDYKGEHPQKSPDICFKLRGDNQPGRVLSTHHALFVECKPVDETHASGGHYCDKGLQRFVDGEYAWAMQDGLMLAYARKGRTIASHLIPAMLKESRPEKLKTVQMPARLPTPAEGMEPAAEPLHLSRHRRDFSWPHGKGQAGDIYIYHSWHSCD